MTSLLKSIKENTGAVITSICILLLVGFYIFRYIPQNENKINSFNLKKNRQFIKRAEELFKEQAEYISPTDIKNSANQLSENSVIKSVQLTGLEVIDSIKSISIKNLIQLSNSPAKIRTAKLLAFDSITAALRPYAFQDTWALIFLKSQNNKPEAKTTFSIISTSKISSEEIDSILSIKERHPLVTSKYYAKTYYAERISPFADDPLNQIIVISAVPQYIIANQARETNLKFTILLVVLIIILALAIPMLKPLISSAQELLKQADLLAVTASVTLLIVIISTVFSARFFNHSSENATITELADLHSKESEYFAKSTYDYKTAFTFVNTELTKQLNFTHSKFTSIAPDTILDTIAGKYIAKTAPNTYKLMSNSLHNVVSAFVINKNGQLIKDITYSQSVPFANYSSRKYFQQLCAGYDTVFSAVKSKLDNKFHLVYAFKNVDSTVAGYTFDHNNNAIYIPPATGYIICDDVGRILLHSDTTKQLNENINIATDYNPKIAALLSGNFKGPIYTTYNQTESVLYAASLSSAYMPRNCAPLYLITFKSLSAGNASLLYTMFQSTAIALIMVVTIVFLLLVYSIILHLNHISVFSRSHIYWLFPDASKSQEYEWLFKLNCIAFIGLAGILYFFHGIALFSLFVIALNLALVYFSVLSQRHFIFNCKSIEKRNFFILLAITIFLSIVTSVLLLHANYKASAFTITLILHLSFIFYLRNQTKTTLPNAIIEQFKINNYCTSIASITSLLFAFFPIIICFLIFTQEFQISNATKEIHKAAFFKTTARFDTTIYTSELNLIEKLSPIKSNAWNDLARVQNTGSFRPAIRNTSTFNADAALVLKNQYFWLPKLLLFGLGILVFAFALIRFYTGRFFFFDLSAFYYINPQFYMHPLSNHATVFSPFSKLDLEILEEAEIGLNNAAPSTLPSHLISTHTKLELINAKALQLHSPAYKAIWSGLTDSEKYALIDFAFDYFINFKNKLILVNLMEKGLIMPDDVTGRLRLMNQSFRNFIRKMPKEDYQFTAGFSITENNQNFAKWKTPLLIVALSLLCLLLFAFRAQYDQIILISGSIVSSVTVISGFLNAYKKFS